MKKIFYLLTIVSFATMVSCQRDALDSKPDEFPLEEVTRIITDMGFDTSGIRVQNGNYIVEGDIAFSRQNLIKLQQTQTRQNRHPSTLSIDRIYSSPIYVYVDASVPAAKFLGDWRAAVMTACDVWTNDRPYYVGLKVKYTTDSTLADITVKGDPNRGPLAYYPMFDEPGNIVIPTGPNWDVDQQTYIIAHEMGHALGFTHTDEPGIHIPGTPASDPYSIMKSNMSTVGGVAWPGLSAGDKAARDSVYPIFALGYQYPISELHPYEIQIPSHHLATEISFACYKTSYYPQLSINSIEHIGGAQLPIIDWEWDLEDPRDTEDWGVLTIYFGPNPSSPRQISGLYKVSTTLKDFIIRITYI